jgi:hypothetical protein
MLNRMQIALILGLEILGIPANRGNYQRICDALYLAQEKGVYISPARILWDDKTRHAYSPFSHEYGGCPSRNLSDDLFDIELARSAGFKDDKNWHLDPLSRKRLEELAKTLSK